MSIGTNTNECFVESRNVEVNDATPTLLVKFRQRVIRTVIQLDCDPVRVCVFIKESNNMDLEGEMLIKDFEGNQNLYVPRIVIEGILKNDLYGIIDPSSTATTEMIHIVEYVG